jgi:hypothetical protein
MLIVRSTSISEGVHNVAKKRTGTAYPHGEGFQIAIRMRPGAAKPKHYCVCPEKLDGSKADFAWAKKFARGLQESYDKGAWDPNATPENESAVNSKTSVLEFLRSWIGCKSTPAAGLFRHGMNSFTDASEGISRAM